MSVPRAAALRRAAERISGGHWCHEQPSRHGKYAPK